MWFSPNKAHIVSQTENAFSVDSAWACESNAIQQDIHLAQMSARTGYISQTTG